MSEVAAKSGKALAWASLWALLVGFLVENWDVVAGAIMSVVPAEYASIAAGVMTLIFKLISLFFKTAPKKIDTRY
jgi:hypothetical protein